MAEPEIDVIICTHAPGKYLVEALDSVQSQTWKHWRITVIDDGSPDPEGLRDLVCRYPHARVLRQVPSGLPAGRNHGIRATEAPFITFLDHDDVWRPDRLERLIVARLKTNDAVVGAYCGGWHIDSAGQRIGEAWSAQPSTSDLMLRGVTPFPRVICLLVDRAAVDAVGGFDETFSLSEDNEFMLRLLAHGELVAVPEQLTGYRRHQGNMTHRRRLEGRAAGFRLLEKNLSAAVDAGNFRLVRQLKENRRRYARREAVASVHASWAELRAGHTIRAAQDLGWALRTAPGSPLSAFRESVSRRNAKHR